MDASAIAQQIADDTGFGSQEDRGALFRAGVDDPAKIGQVQRGDVGQQGHVGLVVGGDRAHVGPVSFEGVGVDTLSLD